MHTIRPGTLPMHHSALLAHLIAEHQDQAPAIYALVIAARANLPAVNRAGYTNGHTVHLVH